MDEEAKMAEKLKKPEEYIDEDADVLDPSECLTYVNSDEAKDMESDFYKCINYG